MTWWTKDRLESLRDRAQVLRFGASQDVAGVLRDLDSLVGECLKEGDRVAVEREAIAKMADDREDIPLAMWIRARGHAPT